MLSFLPSLVGGALIGLSAVLLLVLNGRIAGISRIVGAIGAPRETLVTNVGGFGIPNRLLKSFAYSVFRMAAVSLGFTQRVSHTTAPLSKDSTDGVSSRAACIVRLTFNYRLHGLP